jgi:hypothetical protein
MRRQPVSDPGARQRALDALALSRREGISLTEASRRTRTTRRTVLRHAGAGFAREGRRYAPRPYDRIPREMVVLTADGPERVVLRDSRTAGLVAEHANAVQAYLRTGGTSRLRALPRTSFRLGGQTYVLVTDEDVIDRLAEGGELHYELYRA